jgi:hypothetical protein
MLVAGSARPPMPARLSPLATIARMVEQSIWMQKVTADPGHSHWYVERFRDDSDFLVEILGRK